jgi:alpha-amylase
MKNICFYFQVHQPYRIRPGYTFFSIGQHQDYFDEGLNKMVLQRVAQKCYLPANELLLILIERYDLKVAFSLSGIFIEQCQQWAPEVLDSFKRLYETGNIEFLAETYHHSLAHLFSRDEFDCQIALHKSVMHEVFGVSPRVFRNTELIYNDILARDLMRQGYRGVLAEGADSLLEWRSPNMLYQPQMCEDMGLLLRNYALSDDIAFRFAQQGKTLSTEEYIAALHAQFASGDLINLFMDYETFGEHQWAQTGIFSFFHDLVSQLCDEKIYTCTPLEAIETQQPVAKLAVENSISWADSNRDISPWLGNALQQSAMRFAFEIEGGIKESGNSELLDDWRKLLCSDHFYYMSTKSAEDGEVHRYFSPFSTAHDAYIVYTNILNDMSIRLENEGIYIPDLRFGWSQ